MNLCKIGIHDWEVVYDRWYLQDVVEDFLESLKFVRDENSEITKWEREDGVSVWEWKYYRGSLKDVMPYNPKSKICLRCGKTHKNYSEEKVIAKVHELVLEKEAELARRKKAEEMLGRTN